MATRTNILVTHHCFISVSFQICWKEAFGTHCGFSLAFHPFIQHTKISSADICIHIHMHTDGSAHMCTIKNNYKYFPSALQPPSVLKTLNDCQWCLPASTHPDPNGCPPRSQSSSHGYIIQVKLAFHQIIPHSIPLVPQPRSWTTMLTTTTLSLWIILLFSSGVCARKQRGDTDADDDDDGGDDDGSWSESVSRARCASRCLSLHSVTALSTPLQVRTARGV